MILLINNNHNPKLDEAYALRARILHDRFGWKVNVVGGKEIDVLDDLPPLHMLYLVNDQLKGYLRLLNTTGPTMLERYFGDVFKERLKSPDIWEVSKFCLSDDILDLPYFSKAYHAATMMAGLGKFCWRNDITSLTGIIDSRTRGFYDKAGIEVTVLEQAKIEGMTCYNIIRSMNKSWLQRTAMWFGDGILEGSELVWE